MPTSEYEQFLREASPEMPDSWLEDEEETISINYTSGTTGQPKGVQYTYRGAYLNALSEVIVAGMSPDRSTCGRCRCSTATAGASRGR